MHQIKDNMTAALHTKYRSEAIRIQNLNVGKPKYAYTCKKDVNKGDFIVEFTKNKKLRPKKFTSFLSLIIIWHISNSIY